MHERGRSICYHSRDYGPNLTPLGPITLTNLQTQGNHRLQYEEPDFFFFRFSPIHFGVFEASADFQKFLEIYETPVAEGNAL